MIVKGFLKTLSLFFILAFALLFLHELDFTYASCSTSSHQCCWGACGSGWTTTNTGGSSKTCCATAGSCTADCDCTSSCRVGTGGCGNCVTCYEICNCSCNTCFPRSCPSGSSGTETGPACRFSYGNQDCGYSCNPSGCGGPLSCPSGSRTCYWYENNPAPTTPTAIKGTFGDRTCELGNSIRVPNVNSGSFLAEGSINSRAGDTRGRSPSLSYGYRIPALDLAGTSSTSLPWTTSLNFTEGGTYNIYARAISRNRCSGTRDSSELQRNFSINHKPEVISIEPVGGNPNLGVSGNPSHDGSSHFNCDIQNPKTFEVVFEDKDGCGDIWEDVSPDTNICGGVGTPTLELRALSLETGEPFVDPVSPKLGSISCDSATNLLTAQFTLDFGNSESVHGLELQARAVDIVGDTSGWITRRPWAYDGSPPNLKIEDSKVLSSDEFNVRWEIEDNVIGFSGVRGIRMYASLEKGSILSSDDDYGFITYYPFSDLDDENILDVHSDFGDEKMAFERYFNASVAREQLAYPSEGDMDLVNIGVNNDGQFNFRLEAVDRACNYNDTQQMMELFTPWIATRGGFVHSAEGIDIYVRQVVYGDIPIVYSGEGEEFTSLSTELLTSAGSVQSYGETEYFYELKNYNKRLINRSWYEILLSRAQSRYQNEGEMWTIIKYEPDDDTADPLQIEEEQLIENCRNDRHVYFIEGDFLILQEGQNFYKEIGFDGVNGCIFIVKEDLIISSGEYLSEESDDKPSYDKVRGFFVVDGEIDIEFVDRDRDVRDGLKIVGGLFATGGDKSVKLGRSLQLKNNFHYPTLIIFHDPRYLDIARDVLGDTFGGGYIKDIGLKE